MAYAGFVGRTTVVESFEWAEAKAESNLVDHGVSFFEALTIFEDPHLLELDDVGHEGRLNAIFLDTRAGALRGDVRGRRPHEDHFSHAKRRAPSVVGTRQGEKMGKPARKHQRAQSDQDGPSAESLREIPELSANAKVVRRGPRDLTYTLALLREGGGTTQAEVAPAMGVTPARVSQIESKRIEDLDPRWSTLARYAAALGAELELRVVRDGRSYKVR